MEIGFLSPACLLAIIILWVVSHLLLGFVRGGIIITDQMVEGHFIIVSVWHLGVRLEG